jgi:predicted dehydrogenase
VTDRIRWGIAGTGGISSAFVEDLRLLPDAEAVAVGSRTRASADAFAERYGIAHRHVGYEELAADPEVDAVYVGVPHTAHCEAALAAIGAGKAVLVEKPFALNAAETERMIDAAAKAGTPLMEAMWVRFLPHQVLVRRLLAEGGVGEVRSVIADRGELLSTDPKHRVRAPELGGGALLDLGIYPVSFASMATGGRQPERVEAIGRMTADTGVDAHVSMLFDYPGGAQGVISTSLDARSANSVAINGTEGRILVPQPWGRTSPVELITNDGRSVTTALPHEGHGLRHQAGELGRLLREGLTQSPVIPLEETLAIMRTLDLVRERIGLRYPGDA